MFPSILAKKSWTYDVFELEHKKETESEASDLEPLVKAFLFSCYVAIG
jgi:hypothetical protein